MRIVKVGNRVMLNDKCIGTIYNRTYLKIVKKRNKFRKTNSFGINAEVLTLCDYVIIIYNNTKYTITVQDIYRYGTVKQFTGYEKQYFVPIDKFEVKTV